MTQAANDVLLKWKSTWKALRKPIRTNKWAEENTQTDSYARQCDRRKWMYLLWNVQTQWKTYGGCSFLSLWFPQLTFPDISLFLLEFRNAPSGFCECFLSVPGSPGLVQFVIRTGLRVCVRVCVCVCVHTLTYAGSPCPPAVWGVWAEISCWPERPPCPRSLSSSTPGWLNGWGASRPDPRFHPAACATWEDKQKEGVKTNARVEGVPTQQDAKHVGCND